MKKILLIAFYFTTIPFSNWQPDFEKAKQIAHDKHKLILLNFSGSDWCGPCIRLKTEIFETPDFKNFADSNLVLINADFPRNKANKLSAEQTKQNDSLADKYNTEGGFPYTLLLNADGKIL